MHIFFGSVANSPKHQRLNLNALSVAEESLLNEKGPQTAQKVAVQSWDSYSALPLNIEVSSTS